MTSTPFTINIILNGSQLDAGSLILVERNKKAFRRIQKKMMRARSTLDWSQSNNIFCLLFFTLLFFSVLLIFIFFIFFCFFHFFINFFTFIGEDLMG